MNRSDAQKEATRLLAAVHLQESERVLNSYPHELSGGMAQRVAIALALACQPRLLIADEPTSALDVTVAVKLLHLLRELRDNFGLSLLLISHDLGVIARLCDHVSVISAGRIVEHGTASDVLCRPQHEYTKTLLQAASVPDFLHKGVIDSQACAGEK
jgi:ABC-type dipeptide/oligopeptide/nickel transport system ATPase component